MHGIHILITSLDFWLLKGKKRPEEIQCNFIKPIKLYEEAKFFYFKIDKNKYSIEVIVKEIVHTKITFNFNSYYSGENYQFTKRKSFLIKKKRKALDLSPEYFVKKKFKLKLEKDKIYKKHYLSKTNFGKNFYSSLMAISFFIGMICPGRNAIFASVKLKFNKIYKKNGYAYFYIKNFDTRIGMFNIIVSGFLKGEIKAFYRQIYQKRK